MVEATEVQDLEPEVQDLDLEPEVQDFEPEVQDFEPEVQDLELFREKNPFLCPRELPGGRELPRSGRREQATFLSFK